MTFNLSPFTSPYHAPHAQVIRIWFCNRRQKEKRVHPTVSTETLSLSYIDLTQQLSDSLAPGNPAPLTLSPAPSLAAPPTSRVVEQCRVYHVMPKQNGIIAGGPTKRYSNVALRPKPAVVVRSVTQATATLVSTQPEVICITDAQPIPTILDSTAITTTTPG